MYFLQIGGLYAEGGIPHSFPARTAGARVANLPAACRCPPLTLARVADTMRDLGGSTGPDSCLAPPP
jgi:hypothetical protein